jgi:hypothetical protein
MKLGTLLIVLIALLLGLSLGWVSHGFVATDRCLDRGGAWDGDLDACALPAADVR